MDTEALNTLTNNSPPYPPNVNDPSVCAVQKFAKDNNFTFTLQNPTLVNYNWRNYKNLPANIGMIGPTATKDAYCIVSGTFINYPLTMYLMWDDLTEGKYYHRFSEQTEQQKAIYANQQTTGIVKISLPKNFPQLVLDSNKNDRTWSSIRTEFSPNQLVHLEGDFPQYFDLYLPTGLQINALSLLAPNMMQILKKHSGFFDVEFFGNELILMTRKNLYDPNVIIVAEQALTEQLAYLDRLMQSWSYNPLIPPFDRLQRPAISGNTVKVGGIRVSAKMQLIGIGLLFLLFAIIHIAVN